MKKLTPRQQDVYNFIENYMTEYNHVPSLKQIAHGIGVRAVSVISDHLKNIVLKGWIIRDYSSNQKMELLDDRKYVLSRVKEWGSEDTYKRACVEFYLLPE